MASFPAVAPKIVVVPGTITMDEAVKAVTICQQLKLLPVITAGWLLVPEGVTFHVGRG